MVKKSLEVYPGLPSVVHVLWLMMTLLMGTLTARELFNM